MTLYRAIIDLVMMKEHPMMPSMFYSSLDKIIETISEYEESKQKKGYWIDTGSGQECSECHEIQYGYDNFRYFCAFCGADMRGDKEG